MFGPWASYDGKLDWSSLNVRWAHINGQWRGRCVAHEHTRGEGMKAGIVFENIHEAKAYLEVAVMLSI
jgi:hypothetical protein